jgi:ASC-1-like (ASCH) protein
MAKIILKFRAIDKDIFIAVVNGKKKIETRAATPRYSKIKVGDTLILVCGKQKVKKEIRKVEYFKTMNSIIKKYSPASINPRVSTLEEIKKMWYSFPGYKDKIKKFGLIAWRLK